MSKRTWTGEELQQHLDEWEARLNAGEEVSVSLIGKPAAFPLYPSMDNRLIYEDNQQVALTDSQATAVMLWLQRIYRQQNETLPARPTPRDIQFAGFAKLVTQELREQGFISSHPKAFEIEKPLIEKLIARRAYDLVSYALDNVQFTYVKDIPDMAAWPKDSEA